MKFSIITAVKNADTVIQAAIDSVLSQEYVDFEYLIMDGVSTDNTIEILERNAKCDQRIKYVSEFDGGIYEALNKGIAMAKGDWLYFLGADDLLYSNHVLKKVFDVVSIDPSIKVCYGDVVLSSSHVLYDGEYSMTRFCHQAICHQAIFYSKQLFELYGKYEVKYKINADHVFNMKVFTLIFDEIVYINLPICLYNNETGVSSKCKDKVLMGDYFEIRYNAFRGKVSKKSLARIFYSCFWRYSLSHSFREIKPFLIAIRRDIGFFNLVRFLFVILNAKLCLRNGR